MIATIARRFLRQQRRDVAYGFNERQLFVRHADMEAFLELHRHVHQVERAGAEVGPQGRARRDLGRVDLYEFTNDLNDLF